ncbi:MAG: class II aldolase/adducin family protein [Candidatus Margulisbacteria bacterium]|nr:class II aldolase/adducin family protein [Candidatus Margulisiibacteriota bacterium]MBU1617371.1 class II aldolase/adducin family protein [Candidatus Margulisiibacteriota bacterium]MBU1867547.1 class II aldolase/adducin family protein [Candidatus Margulisiibacteriota bacterium]
MEEGTKVTPKFTTEFLDRQVPGDPRIDELKKWCDQFTQSGLMPSYEGGVYGNLSFRLKPENRFIITSSGMKETSAAESFVKVDRVDLEQKIVYAAGQREPSSESMFHYLIYQKRPEVNAVFHGHCQKLLDNQARLGLVSTEWEKPYGTMELADQIMTVLGKNDFLIIKNHGFISLGKNMAAAGDLALKTMARCAFD